MKEAGGTAAGGLGKWLRAKLIGLAAVTARTMSAFVPSVSSAQVALASRTSVSATPGHFGVSRGQVRVQKRSQIFAVQAEPSSVNEQNRDQPFRADEIPHKLSLGERARTVAHVCRTGTLCTASEKHSGHPFGSHVDYILNDDGHPVFLLANNATHTKNLRSNPLCSLFCQPVTSSGQGGGRCTLVGKLEPLADEQTQDLKETYIYYHPHAEQALNVADKFQFYSMKVEDIYFVGGFGVSATWVEPRKFIESNPDPLAFDAPGIISTMNSEKSDDLKCLVRVFIGVENPEQVTMMSLDRLGFDLRVRTGSETKEYRIAFREKVSNRFDVQSALTKTLQEAWEKENGYGEVWENTSERPVIMYYQSYQTK